MSRFDDYGGMTALKGYTDDDLERLISGEPGAPSASDLERFISRLRLEATVPPKSADVDLFAVRAAAVARAELPVEPKSSRTWKRISRPALAAAAMALLVGLSGVAYASDQSAPGDLLYGVDIALEQIGIGDGDSAERFEEASVLAERGLHGDALALMHETLIAMTIAPDTDLGLDDLAAQLADDESSAQAAEKVDELLAFIKENAGNGVGLDGREFGQQVAEIARGDADESNGDVSAEDEDQNETNDESSVPGNDETDNPGNSNPPGHDNPGQSADPPGNSGNSNTGGNGNGQSGDPPGNSGNSNAGGNGNGQSGDPPGNSGNSNAGGNGKP